MRKLASLTMAGAMALAAAGLATSANATAFAGSYTTNVYGDTAAEDGNAGLKILTQETTPGVGAGFAFNLNTLADLANVSLFDIWTDEGSVQGDDLAQKTITVSFDFTAPNPIQDGSVGGVTGAFTGFFSGGYVVWANGGNQTFNFGNGGQLSVHLNDAVFNESLFGDLNDSNQGYSQRAAITGTFSLNSLSAAVPEPATWGMMIMGFGMAGAIVRRRRTAVFA